MTWEKQLRRICCTLVGTGGVSGKALWMAGIKLSVAGGEGSRALKILQINDFLS